MAEGETRISGYSPAADCRSTLNCLAALGAGIRHDGATVVVEGRPWTAPSHVLDAGNSGSTIRMLMGALAGSPFAAILDGDASLRRRPMERVAAPLRRMGAQISTTDDRPPVTIQGGPLQGITLNLEVASAQVKTAVLLAGLRAHGNTEVAESASSRDHTERLLPAFGAPVRRDGLRVSLTGGHRLEGIEATVPGDPSSAAFLLVAGLVRPNSEVRCDGVGLNPKRIGFLYALRAMGASIDAEVHTEEPEPLGAVVARSSSLHGAVIDGDAIPALVDEVPILAVAAALAEGETVFRGVGELRVKESDRIAAMVEGLRALGANAEATTDTLVVRGPARLRGAPLRSHGDHRIAMALAIAALAADGPSRLDDAGCVGVSYPGFWQALAEGVA